MTYPHQIALYCPAPAGAPTCPFTGTDAGNVWTAESAAAHLASDYHRTYARADDATVIAAARAFLDRLSEPTTTATADGARPTLEPLCGCGHTVDRHCAHCDRCSGTLAELDLEPWEIDMPGGTVCLCTAYGPADR